jgi:hypothetical protein
MGMKREKLLRVGFSAAQAEIMAGEVQALVTAGSTATDATLATGETVIITGGTGGIRLAPAQGGDSVDIYNISGAAATLYPPTGATVNNTTSVSLSATNKSCRVIFRSATACYTIPAVPS